MDNVIITNPIIDAALLDLVTMSLDEQLQRSEIEFWLARLTAIDLQLSTLWSDQR